VFTNAAFAHHSPLITIVDGPGQHFSDLNLVLHLEGDLDVSLTAFVKSIRSWRNSTVGKGYCVET
jgi:hypothetical protein